MLRVLVLAALLGTTAHADPTYKSATAWCADHASTELVFDHDQVTPKSDPDTHYHVNQRVRIDPDKQADLILDEGGCGTQECLHGAYVHCPDGTFSLVYRDYGARVRVKSNPGHWATLEYESVGERNRDGTRDRMWIPVRFTGTEYVSD